MAAELIQYSKITKMSQNQRFRVLIFSFFFENDYQKPCPTEKKDRANKKSGHTVVLHIFSISTIMIEI